MGTMLETIQNVIIPEPEPQAEAQPVTTPPEDSAIENQLTQEISELWSNHTLLSASRKMTAKELRQIRARLAERLYEMKSLLSRPGRSGQWRSWLRERGIPRSSADRLALQNAETLGIENGNVPSGAIPEPTAADVERLFNSLLPRLRNNLTTPWAAYEFLHWIVGGFDLACETKPYGIMVFDPSVKEPSSTIATPMAVGQAAAAADTGSGEVA